MADMLFVGKLDTEGANNCIINEGGSMRMIRTGQQLNQLMPQQGVRASRAEALNKGRRHQVF